MNVRDTHPATPPRPPEPEIQTGHERSIARNEELERLIRQHPQRDEPRVDDIESPGPPRP
jgi:hypothetical protein